uniref:Uncharacterized protein n=1 Tax=Ciona savignyi TaxID=51511 RepID=H2Y9F4_CIOSA
MDRIYEVGMTPDNTKVMKLMGDFYDFMDHAKEDSMRQSSSISAIPFHLPSEDDDKQSTVMQNVRNKVKLKQLEAIHSSNEKSLTKRNIALETKIGDLESMNLHLKERCSNYEARVQEITQQAIDFHDQLKEAQDSKLTEVSKWEQSAADVHKLKLENEQKLTHQLELFRSENNELAEQNRELENNEKMMEIKFAEIYSQLEHYKSTSTDRVGNPNRVRREQDQIDASRARDHAVIIQTR